MISAQRRVLLCRKAEKYKDEIEAEANGWQPA